MNLKEILFGFHPYRETMEQEEDRDNQDCDLAMYDEKMEEAYRGYGFKKNSKGVMKTGRDEEVHNPEPEHKHEQGWNRVLNKKYRPAKNNPQHGELPE